MNNDSSQAQTSFTESLYDTKDSSVKVRVIRKFETRFRRNSVNIIYGPNGSGKSILLRSILFAFGRRHKYFSEKVSSDGTIRLKLFPNQTSINITDTENQNSMAKGFKCLIADGLLARIPRKMVVPVLNKLNDLGIQVIMTASLLVDRKKLPKHIRIFSLENIINTAAEGGPQKAM